MCTAGRRDQWSTGALAFAQVPTVSQRHPQIGVTVNEALWRALGDLLVARRVEIDPRWRNRRLFSEETRGETSFASWYRLIGAVEGGERDNYSRETLVLFEGAYRLRPGAIRRFIAGGPLEVAAASEAEKPPTVIDIMEPVKIALPEGATEAEQAAASAIEGIIASLQKQILDARTERSAAQARYERQLAELQARIEDKERDGRSGDDGNRHSA